MMRCQQCDHEILPGASYCHSCGWQVQPQCRTCSAFNPSGSLFCSNCGASLTPSEAAPTAGSSTRVETKAPPRVVTCPRCYGNNEPGSTFCFACGLPLDMEVGSSSRMPNRITAFAMGQPGGFWIRLLASIIDGLILLLAFAVLWRIISGESLTDYWESSQFGARDIFQFALDIVYYTLTVSIWSTTAGKRPFGLYVLRSDGSEVGTGRAFARYLAYFLSFITLGIGFIMIGLRQDKRGLHDLICDTVVIKR